MSTAWLVIAVLALATAAIRASGPVALGGRELAPPVRAVISLLAPCLLAALVVVQTLGEPAGGAIALDARVLGVGAAAAVLALGGGTLSAVGIAAVATALARALG